MDDRQPRVFVSYVSDNEEVVVRLCVALREVGIDAWRDKDSLRDRGGARWRSAIRGAIRDGHRFVACFSAEYCAREVTEMNEELRIAVEELRKRAPDSDWFVPVRLSECTVPAFEIGRGETLDDLERINMFPDWAEGMRRLVATLLRTAVGTGTAGAARSPAGDPVRAVRRGISAWRRGASPESIRAAKAQLTAALDAALESALGAAEVGDSARIEQIAGVFRETYEWGRHTSLGLGGQPARDEMLTYAMPSFEAIVRFYVLGAMLAKLRLLPECRNLATGHHVEMPRGTQPMARHPLWGEYHRGVGEADRSIHFKRALDIVAARDEFAVPPPGTAGDPLCEFDLLVEVHLQIVDPVPGEVKHCPNYAHFPAARVKRVCADLVERRDEPGVLPAASAGNLAVALVAADWAGWLLYKTRGVWHPNEDWPPVVQQYLQEHGAADVYTRLH